MRVAILSMQRVINYGSFMQAYALKELLKKNLSADDEVKFIDINKGEHICRYTVQNKITNYKKIIQKGIFFEKLKDRVFMKKLSEQFYNHFYSILDLKSEYNNETYDVAVIGSDEVFHFYQNTAWGFTTQLYGDVKNANRVFSYAGSFGATTLEIIEKYAVKEKIKNALNKMKSVSVRDANSYKIVSNLLDNKDIEIHLDPVLLYDFSKEVAESKDIHGDGDYIIVYSYTGRICDTKEIESIQNFARSKKLKIYTIFSRYPWADKTVVPETPFQVLKWFERAQYVVSDTFHCSIFSIITHIKFCTLIRKSNYEKISSLLERFNLKKQMLFDSEQLQNTIEREIDWNYIDSIRVLELDRTMKYIRENLYE